MNTLDKYRVYPQIIAIRMEIDLSEKIMFNKEIAEGMIKCNEFYCNFKL